jgi:hypothetical protein
MPVINFPENPSVGDEYTFGVYTWEWSGLAWKAVATTAVDASPYSPDDETNWDSAPSTIAEALDELAARLKALES